MRCILLLFPLYPNIRFRQYSFPEYFCPIWLRNIEVSIRQLFESDGCVLSYIGWNHGDKRLSNPTMSLLSIHGSLQCQLYRMRHIIRIHNRFEGPITVATQSQRKVPFSATKLVNNNLTVNITYDIIASAWSFRRRIWITKCMNWKNNWKSGKENVKLWQNNYVKPRQIPSKKLSIQLIFGQTFTLNVQRRQAHMAQMQLKQW